MRSWLVKAPTRDCRTEFSKVMSFIGNGGFADGGDPLKFIGGRENCLSSRLPRLNPHCRSNDTISELHLVHKGSSTRHGQL